MTRKIVFGVMTVALVAIVAMPSASAACNPPKSAVTFGAAGTAYWLPATAVGTASVQAWQLGAPGTFAGTGCPNTFLFPDGPGFSLNYDLGFCGAGCPGPLNANILAVLAQNRTATGTEFLLATAAENAAAINNYEFAPQGNHTMIPIPKPFVNDSARVGSNVNLHISIPSIAGGCFGPNAASAITGFNVLAASTPRAQASDPGRDASAYSLRSTIPSAGGAPVLLAPITLDCSNTANDQWVVLQIQLENGTVLSNSVGQSIRVNCDPTLANPKTPKVKVAPKEIAN